MLIAVYPGNFDPMTLGRLDITERTARIIDRVIIGVLDNNSKTPLFSVEERVSMLRSVTAHITSVGVQSFDKLLVDFVRKNGANVIVRGLRTITNFEYELQLSRANRIIAPEIDTLFLTTNLKYSYLSSSIMKGIATYHGDIGAFLSPEVLEQAERKINDKNHPQKVKRLYNMSRIEQLIEEVEGCTDGCKFQSLSNTKVLMNREGLERLLVEPRLWTPDEIKRYQRTTNNQDVILNEARIQADVMIQEANAQTNELVNRHEIIQRAYAAVNQAIEQASAQAQETVDTVANDAYNVRQNTMWYIGNMLNSL